MRPNAGQQKAPPTPRGSSPQPPQKPRFRMNWWWLAFLAGLLAINFYASSRATQAESRVRVPYSPFFLQQVRDGHVVADHVEGNGDPGEFKKPKTYEDSKPTKLSRQRSRAFADTDALSQLLQSKGVIVNAEPLDTGGAVVAEPAARLRPDDPLRRPAVLADAPRGQRAERARLLRPRVGAPVPAHGRPRHVRRRRRDRRGEGGAVGGRRLPAPPREVPDSSAAASRTACCSPARRARARRCSRAPSPARRTFRSSRCPRRSSSRRSSASARRACATCSRRRRRRRRRSCSSTSSTRSAARARPASPGSAAATTSASRR